jgi:segregation and condensation protein B
MKMEGKTSAHHTAMVLFSVLFVAPEPISLTEIQSKLNLTNEALLEGFELLKTIIECHTPLYLQEIENKLILRTKAEYGEYLQIMHKVKKQRLSDAALETLAIIAYKQPVIKAELDKIRGVDCDSTLAKLSAEGFIKAVGNLSRPGSPVLYQTTEKFLMTFNLKGLKDLPSLRDFSP